jgi:hypothetical protein
MARRDRAPRRPAGFYDHRHMLRVFGLEVIGSVIFLTMVLISGGTAFPLAKWAGTGWYGAFYVLAVISSLALFLLSFVNLIEIKRNISTWTMFASIVALFSLMALTYGNLNYVLMSIVAFILTFGGSEFAHNYSRQQKTAHNETVDMSSLGLEVLGAIAFIIVSLAAVNGAYPNAAMAFSGAEPILYSLGAACAFALFMLGFGGQALSKEYLWVAVIGGLSLIAVTFGSISFFIVTLVGFILAILGSGMALSRK